MARPATAVGLLHELGLCGVVFRPPQSLSVQPPAGGFKWGEGALVAAAAARVLAACTHGIISTDDTCKTINIDADMERQLPPEGTGKRTRDCDSRRPHEVDYSQVAMPNEAFSGQGLERADVVEGRDCSDSRRGELQCRDPALPANDKAMPHPTANSEHKNTEDLPITTRELFLASALFPLAKVKHILKKGKCIPAAQSVVGESLKLKAKEGKNVGDILEAIPVFKAIADSFELSGAPHNESDDLPTPRCSTPNGDADCPDRTGAELSRLQVGLAVRQVKELWPACVHLCCAVEMCGLFSDDIGHHDGAVGSADDGISGGDIAGHGKSSESDRYGRTRHHEQPPKNNHERQIIAKYIGLTEAIGKMGLSRAWCIPPVMTGNELMHKMEIPRSPVVGKLMSEQVRWQLQHPDGGIEECLAHLRCAVKQMQS